MNRSQLSRYNTCPLTPWIWRACRISVPDDPGLGIGRFLKNRFCPADSAGRPCSYQKVSALIVICQSAVNAGFLNDTQVWDSMVVVAAIEGGPNHGCHGALYRVQLPAETCPPFAEVRGRET